MNTTEQILLIILGSFLALFLALGIVVLSYTIKLVKTMRDIAEKAKDVADNVEVASEMFKKTAGPLAAGKFFMNLAEMVNKRKKGK